MTGRKHNLLVILALLSNLLFLGDAFSPSAGFGQLSHVGGSRSNDLVVMEAKRKRRRKQPPDSAGAGPSEDKPAEKVAMAPPEPASLEKTVAKADDFIDDTIDDEEEIDVAQLVDVAKFSFDDKNDSGKGVYSLQFLISWCITT